MYSNYRYIILTILCRFEKLIINVLKKKNRIRNYNDQNLIKIAISISIMVGISIDFFVERSSIVIT